MQTLAPSQSAAILSDLQEGQEITALDALARHGVFRLAARVLELRAEGWDIETQTREVNGKRIAVYRLGSKPRQEVFAL